MKQIITVLSFLFAVFSTNAQADNHNHQQEGGFTVDTYKKFPPFPLLNLDSARVNSSQAIENKKKTVVVYFSPICNHCQHLAEDITGNMKSFKNVKFLFISSYSITEIKTFANNYGLNKFKNISLFQDDQYKFVNFYKLRSLPGIFVYDTSQDFLATMPDHFKIEDLIKAVN